MTVHRVAVTADLRDDWPAALREAGATAVLPLLIHRTV